MIGLVVPANVKYCPYVLYYLDLFKKNNISYEIISWDKRALDEDVAYAMRFPIEDVNTKMRILGYFKFARFATEICKKRKYKGLIIFTIAPAIVLSRLLKKEYKGRYYLDIRDDTILRKLMKNRTKEVIKNACAITSSSNEFNQWIQRETTLCHNVDVNLIEDALDLSSASLVNASDSSRAKIMFAGMMKEEDINIELIDKLKNDDRFSFIYHGSEDEGKKKIIDFCKKNEVKNVSFYGVYKKEEIYSIYRNEADWCNIIRCDCVVNRNALPNKLYDAMIAGVPVVVLSHNKAVCDYVKKYNLGMVFDNLDDLKDNFFEKSKTFDRQIFQEGRIKFLKEVSEDFKKFDENVLAWTNSVLKD